MVVVSSIAIGSDNYDFRIFIDSSSVVTPGYKQVTVDKTGCGLDFHFD